MSSKSNRAEIYQLFSIFKIGDKLGVNYGWIGNSDCSSECPSNCKDKTWQYWKGKTAGGKDYWIYDPSIRAEGNAVNKNCQIGLEILFIVVK